MEVITYILGNIWHFIGFIIILGVIFEGVVEIIKAIKSRY